MPIEIRASACCGVRTISPFVPSASFTANVNTVFSIIILYPNIYTWFIQLMEGIGTNDLATRVEVFNDFDCPLHWQVSDLTVRVVEFR